MPYVPPNNPNNDVVLCFSLTSHYHLSLLATRLFTSVLSTFSEMGGRRDCYNGEWGTTFRARKWRSLDPCGLACVSLSAGIHFFAFATIVSSFLRHSSVGVVLFVVVFFPSTLMALWSLYMAWSSDPGAVPMVRSFHSLPFYPFLDVARLYAKELFFSL